MSAEGQGDSPSLDKDDDASTPKIQPGTPKNSLGIEAGISKHPSGDGPGPLTFMGEVLEPFDDDVETVIEKKLPLEKDKGLDVDSELDFELKWDDDTDNTNDDQSKSKTDAKVESGLDLNMSAEGQGDSPSLDKDDDASTPKIQPGTPKNSLGIEAGISKHPSGDGPGPLTFMGEVLEPFDDDVETVIEKKLPLEKDKGLDVDSELDFELKWDDDTDNTNDDQSKSKTDAKVESGLDCDDEPKSDNEPFNQKTHAAVDTVTDESLIKEKTTTGLETIVIPKIIEKQVDVIDEISVASAKASKDDAAPEETKLIDASSVDSNVFLDTNIKIGLDSEMSLPVSENSSLDERLVYSDVEIPEIEDEELLDELDAQISQVDPNLDEKVLEDETVTIKTHVEPENIIEESDDTVPQQTLGSEMDVDEIKDEKSDPNDDTFTSTNDLETSSYEINNEHKLTNPDVMLEIPTQELIETFDDSDMSDAALEYDEDVLLNNDVADNDTVLIEGKLQITDDLKNANENKETTCDEDKIQSDIIINVQPDILQIEDTKVSTKTSEMMDEDELLESSSENDFPTNIEVTASDNNEINLMDVDTENEDSHADIILEASHLEPKVIEETEDPIADLASTTTLKAEDINIPAALSPKLDTEVVKISSSSDIEAVSVNIKEITPVVEMTPEMDKELKETHSSADFVPKMIPETMEVVCTAEVPTVAGAVKEVTDDDDALEKVVKEFTTSPAETEPEVPSEATASCKANPENITAVKEVITINHNPLKVVEEIKTTLEIDPEVSAEVTEAKKDTSTEADLEVAPVKEVSTTDDLPPEVVKEVKTTTAEIEPVTTEAKEEAVADVPIKEIAGKEESKDTAQPSTSKYMQESSDEDQEPTDSLGLLAESSRVMDDDDEQEHDDEDDDDDFDQDDESNQMIDQSEDSNAQHSETEVKETMEADQPNVEPVQFQIAEVLSTTDIEVLGESEVTESLEATEDTEVETAVKSLLEIEEATNIEEAVDAVTETVECGTEDAGKLSEEPVKDDEAEGAASKLRELLTKEKGGQQVEAEKTSPSKTKKLEIAKPKNEINIVELEESSSEDDIQEVSKNAPEEKSDVTTVNIPDEVEVMSASAGTTSEMRHGEGEVVISGVPKPPPQKLARLNTSEVTIKTAAATTESLVIPEAKMSTPAASDGKPKLGLEIFSLDSDDDEKQTTEPKQLTAVEIEKCINRCINVQCTGAGSDTRPAGAAAVAYYGGRRGAVCRQCDMAVTSRGLSLIEGIKDYTPLLSLHMGQIREELVEISDSDSEEEITPKTTEEGIGEKEAAFLEVELAAMFNKTWKKYSMDARLKGAESEINLEVLKLEEECSKINTMLNECQVATDKLRNDLYDTFSGETNELPAIMIYDTPSNTWSGLEDAIIAFENKETRQSKRRSSIPEPPAKRPAIPLGYAPLDSDTNTAQNEPKAASATDVAMQNDDDNSDISVVKLSAEAAPADLPLPGTMTRPPLRPQMIVYAMRNAFGSWSRARIMDVQPKVNGQFTMCRVKFEHKVKNPTKTLQARCLAYEHPSDVRMTIGTRLIALFKDNDNKRESYYSGIVAEIPNPVNNYRYLVFFDDGYAQYVQHSATRLVCECAPLVWDEVHPFSRQFVREYLCSYPERPMVRVHAGQSIRTEYNGKWWDSKVLQVDASLVQVHFDKENRTEWIYRGSTRLAPLYWELQAAERQRARPLPRAQPGRRFNMPYVEYTRSDETAPPAVAPSPAQIEQDIRRQRAVAKKSTAAAPPPPPAPSPPDGIASRVVFYTPKNAIKPHKMVPHTCGARCRRTDVLALKDLRTYNPLTKPLLSGWERQIVKFKWSRSVMYRAPCGRRLRNYEELHRYLQVTGSDMPVDLFDFGANTHCLAEFVLTKCRISKKDLSHGKENVPVPCVNYYDDSLPEFCSYNTERTPTAGVPLNLDPEFLCGCDCTDDCADKSKCACWKMTLEGARTIGLDSDEVGYVYKRLPDPLPSGIYECNSRCKCRQTCLNRVAQHPLQLKLQVFKTLNRGWGIRALNDIPKGAFLCVYAGNLLTDATANLDGLNEGDEYLAELDYIEVVEQMKEGFEEDVPDADKKLDKDSGDQDDDSATTSSSEEEEDPRKNADDDDFRPTLPLAHAPTDFSKRLRKREKKKKEEKEKKQKERDLNSEDNCITISDDEELREPARFAAQAGMGDKGFVSKYKSVRAHFGKDEACYIMDAKVQGNIGRYLNVSYHSTLGSEAILANTRALAIVFRANQLFYRHFGRRLRYQNCLWRYQNIVLPTRYFTV
ncbi:uncharacterized protein [Choristoneura fumiferana]|uniref:uncharacterized protein n=1 Tax=Choristoneura fumiferana TaxID=7141 RepID=UPI003D15894E